MKIVLFYYFVSFFDFFVLNVILGKFSFFMNIMFVMICDYLIVVWNELELDGGLLLIYFKIELRDEIELLDEVFVGV